MKLPYIEGSVFLVPLRGGGFARGVVARKPSRAGRCLLGYFFGPKLESSSNLPSHQLDPGDAVLRVRFGDLGLVEGSWPVLGIAPEWDRSKWPFPDFVRHDPLTGRAYLVRYCDTDPRRIEFEKPVDPNCDLPADGLSGSGAVEIRLTRLLGAGG